MTAYRACRTSTTRNPQSLCLATYTGQFPTLSKAYMKLIDDSVRIACMELTDDSVRMALSKQSAMWQKCLKKKSHLTINWNKSWSSCCLIVPGLILISAAVCVEFANSPCDRVGFLWMLWFPPTSQRYAVL